MLGSDDALQLRRLWDQHRSQPLPAAAGNPDPRIQEISLYEAWLGGIVETALDHGGRVTPSHRHRLKVRAGEGNQSLWAAGTGLGEAMRAYVARLFAIQALVEGLPDM